MSTKKKIVKKPVRLSPVAVFRTRETPAPAAEAPAEPETIVVPASTDEDQAPLTLAPALSVETVIIPTTDADAIELSMPPLGEGETGVTFANPPISGAEELAALEETILPVAPEEAPALATALAEGETPLPALPIVPQIIVEAVPALPTEEAAPAKVPRGRTGKPSFYEDAE